MNTITIEKTAKRFKLMLILAVLMMLGSVIWMACIRSNAQLTNESPDYAPACVLLASGVVMWLIAKVAIWWHHG